jgi:hypothetical protein
MQNYFQGDCCCCRNSQRYRKREGGIAVKRIGTFDSSIFGRYYIQNSSICRHFIAMLPTVQQFHPIRNYCIRRRRKFLSTADQQISHRPMTEPPKKKRKQHVVEVSQKVITIGMKLTALKPKKKKNATEDEDEFVVRWQNPALQADLVIEKLRTLNPKMSAIELGELSIRGTLLFYPPLIFREMFSRYCNLGILGAKCRRHSRLSAEQYTLQKVMLMHSYS